MSQGPTLRQLLADNPAAAGILDSMSGPCRCKRCVDRPDLGFENPAIREMLLCEICHNKRCPKATWHGYRCSGSNELGQVGEPE